jgi:hypothetical protein
MDQKIVPLIGLVILSLVLIFVNSTFIVATVGQEAGHCKIQKINLASVDALCTPYSSVTYVRDYNSVPRTLWLGNDVGVGCNGISIKLVGIDAISNTATFIKTVGTEPYGGCPICLSGNTLIDTPNREINIKELKPGMLVWTADKLGQRQTATILKVGKTAVSSTHKMVRIILEDGRELFGSPNHPTADGRLFGELRTGDILDKSRVKSDELVSYEQKYAYDLLPSGETGFYWANGILVGSTLK